MKTKINIIIVILLLSIKINSQVTFKPGVRVGLNSSKIDGINDDAKTDFYIGIFGELKLGNRYALQPEITYSKQGSENVDLNYVSIGLANKFYFFPEETPIFILVKPSLDINADSQTNSSGEGLSKIDADFSFAAGIGYEFPFGLDIEARYVRGILDVSGSSYLSGYNSVIKIGAAYKFDFRK